MICFAGDHTASFFLRVPKSNLALFRFQFLQLITLNRLTLGLILGSKKACVLFGPLIRSKTSSTYSKTSSFLLVQVSVPLFSHEGRAEFHSHLNYNLIRKQERGQSISPW